MSQFSYINYQSPPQTINKTSAITHDKVCLWTQNNMFKTSSGAGWGKEIPPPKTSALPGYLGYIPGKKSDNIFGRTFTNTSRVCFDNPNLALTKIQLTCNGFSIKPQSLIDTSKHAYTYKYGGSNITANHPNWEAKDKLESTSKSAFKNPRPQSAPTFKKNDPTLVQNSKTLQSGFITNYKAFEGKGWKPEKVLEGDYKQTVYRETYNTPVSFHRSTKLPAKRQIQSARR